MIRYSIVCQGKTKNNVVICPGWGRWGSPDETCPTCDEKVFVAGTVAVTPLKETP